MTEPREVRALLDRTGWGTKTLPVRPKALAEALGIQVKGVNLDIADGMLVRIGSIGRILYSQSIAQPGRIAFTIAHELGHWELHPNLSQIQACTAADIREYRGSKYELEANAFAAELLMPTPAVLPIVSKASATLQTIQRIASHCQTTFLASAIRLIELTQEPAILVISRNNKVAWSRRSKKASDLCLTDCMSDESSAWNCSDTIQEAVEPVQVEASLWFPSSRYVDRLEVYEQSAVLGDFDLTVTMLTCYEM